MKKLRETYTQKVNDMVKLSKIHPEETTYKDLIIMKNELEGDIRRVLGIYNPEEELKMKELSKADTFIYALWVQILEQLKNVQNEKSSVNEAVNSIHLKIKYLETLI